MDFDQVANPETGLKKRKKDGIDNYKYPNKDQVKNLFFGGHLSAKYVT